MISVDGSLFIQIANFLLLIWVLNLILYRPIRNILSERKEKITGMEDNIDAFGKDAADRDAQYDSGIRSARAKGMQEKEKLIQAAEAEEKDIIAKINEKAQADLAKMKENVAKEADAVRKELLQQVDTFATEIGKKILGRAV
ncbi:MAG: ATP synthase F0 subunit B [Desulfococcaceae bacterium]|jgi:F-type H+-transporting ATPase subunit b|nr:ATP synthase F0 subunit B [Desulfococcaceae bacterium]